MKLMQMELNKTRQGKANPWMWASLILIAVVVVGLLGFAYVNSQPKAASVAGSSAANAIAAAPTSSVGTSLVSQNISNSSYNLAQPGTLVGAAVQLYDPTATTKLNGVNTQPGSSYIMEYTLSGYAPTILTQLQNFGPYSAVFTTPINFGTVNAKGLLKQFDTATIMTPENSNFAANNASANITVGTGGIGNGQIAMQQNGSYKFIGGEGNNLPGQTNNGPQFAVYFGVFSPVNYSQANFGVSWSEPTPGQPSACTRANVAGSPYTAQQPSANKAGTTLLGAVFICNGDYAATDAGPQYLKITEAALAGTTIPTGTAMNVSILPMVYYPNSVSGSLAGGYGPTDNTGATLAGVVIQNSTLYTN